MPGYSTALQVYYCKQVESPGASHRLAPAPQISINPELYYANDNIIGYTYKVTLSGYANALRKEIDAGSVEYGLEPTVAHMGDIREIFNTNGGNLYIKQGNTDVLVAKGATIQNIQFSESDNRWVNYSPYTIELEFNEIDFKGCLNTNNIECNNSIFHQIAGAVNTSDLLIDIKKYKIKEFKDSWTFTIDNQIYDNFGGIDNNVFKVSYSLSATGKNYYVNDNLVPAWQQARLFVQDKLYKQIFGLLSGSLQIDKINNSSCDTDKNLATIHNTDTTPIRSDGLVEGFTTLQDGSPNYGIYNETISCDTSESDGTFSIVYNAICKKYDPALSPLANAILHTYTKNLTVSTDQKIDASIVVEGKIQGLVRGGFIHYNGDFTLPQSGVLITSIDSSDTKYNNALQYFNTKVGSTTDLFNSHKDLLNIKKSQLLIKGEDGYPAPSNFTLDHNYFDGAINYNATYERSIANAIDKGFTNISITRQDPVEIIQEFIIPGRIQGPIIQKLNMKTSRTVTVNIEGASPANKKCDIGDICNNIPSFSIDRFEELLAENNSWLKTKEDYTTNLLDGSYSISLEYTLREC